MEHYTQLKRFCLERLDLFDRPFCSRQEHGKLVNRRTFHADTTETDQN